MLVKNLFFKEINIKIHMFTLTPMSYCDISEKIQTFKEDSSRGIR